MGEEGLSGTSYRLAGRDSTVCGPLFHNFVDETLDQVNYEDSVYFNNFEKTEKEKGETIWKGKIFFCI